jgi:NAD(P)-dependent dehydrogenase (short-subunit alcohol dehydrogenase family)
MGRLEGKVVVITGAGSGIGRGTAELFAREGAHIIAADIADDRGRRLEESQPGRIKYVHCNVLEEAEIAAAIAAAEAEFGRLDCVFNNAGAGGANETVAEISAAGFDSVMHLHVRAALFGIKHALPALKRASGGAIITTASVAGLSAGYGPVLYSVAKAAIIHMTTVAAVQLAEHRIRVNCICPGLIATNIFATALGLPSQLADTRLEAIATATSDSQPLRRGGLPRDIAEAALYLASDGADWVTGQALVVDGGLTLGPIGMQQLNAFAPILQALMPEAAQFSQTP